MTSSIDRAEWHYGGDFPKELSPEAGGTHIGMYLAWIIQRDLGSATLRKYARDSLPQLRQRRITGRDLLFTDLDEKFFATLLTRTGRNFTRDYYETGCYVDDYDAILGGTLPTLYHVEDTWENYDRLAPVLDRRFASWQEGKPPLAGAPLAQVKRLEEQYLDTILEVAGKLPEDPVSAIRIFQQYLSADPPPAYRNRALTEMERVRNRYGIAG